MRIEADSVVPYPRPLVFLTYRDELTLLVPFLPDVRAIEVQARIEEGPIIRAVNVWRAGPSMPDAVSRIVGESLAWTDYATWDERTFSCDWRLEPHAFKDAVVCSGTNRLVELDADRTRFEIQGDISLDFGRVKGVPAPLAEVLARTAEKYLVRQITANLTSVSDGLTKYLHTKP